MRIFFENEENSVYPVWTLRDGRDLLLDYTLQLNQITTLSVEHPLQGLDRDHNCYTH